MNKHVVIVPRDLFGRIEYSKLVNLLDGRETVAVALVARFFTWIPYAVEISARAGFCRKTEAQQFQTAIAPLIVHEIPEATKKQVAPWTATNGSIFVFELLEQAGFVSKTDDGYVCPIVRDLNPLNQSSPGVRGRIEAAFQKHQKKGKTMALKLIEELRHAVPGAWTKAEGGTIDDATMHRAVTLVWICDRLIHGRGFQRPIADYEIGLLTSAVSVVEKNADAKLAGILKRFIAVRDRGVLPETTAILLQRFQDFVTAAAPPDGYGAWLATSGDAAGT